MRRRSRIIKEYTMANLKLFSTATEPKSSVINNAGASAYARTQKEELLQHVLTGCFNSTFYVKEEQQLTKVLDIALNPYIDTEFLGKLAVYSRTNGYMKDAPAALCAALMKRDLKVFKKVFPKVIDNMKMLRTFMQIVRSNVVGRKSFGHGPKKLVQKWLDSLTDEQLFKSSIGNDPSLADIIKMVHPKPKTKSRDALYSYLIGKEKLVRYLPKIVKDFEKFKVSGKNPPDVPFQLLTGTPASKETWKEIAYNASWQTARMNLNTFLRHGIFDDTKVVNHIAKLLVDKKAIKKSKVFPYQLLAALLNVDDSMPTKIVNALQEAVEIAAENVPELDGRVYVMVDVSGSMSSPVTGYRDSATSKVRCIDVAALFASCLLRKNKEATLIPFDTSAYNSGLNAFDSIITNAQKLAAYGGGGTNCSLPLEILNSNKVKGDLVIYISDNESWADNNYGYGSKTPLIHQWRLFKARNPKAKLVCIDLTPNSTTQVSNGDDRLNIGGFSDNVFTLLSMLNNDELSGKNLLKVVDNVDLET